MNLDFKQAIFCYSLIHSVIITLASLTNPFLQAVIDAMSEKKEKEKVDLLLSNYSLTHSLTHWYLFTHSFTHSLIDTYSLTLSHYYFLLVFDVRPRLLPSCFGRSIYPRNEPTSMPSINCSRLLVSLPPVLAVAPRFLSWTRRWIPWWNSDEK